MQFEKFRILVTILAAFGVFFAYFGRLNLSLVIEKMTVPSSAYDAAESDPVANELSKFKMITSLQRSFSEEQTLALLSIGNPSYWKPTSPHKGTRANQTRVGRLPQKSFAASRAQVQMLSMDVGAGSSQSTNNDKQSEEESPPKQVDVLIEEKAVLLNWDKETKDNLQGAFFVGYVISQIPAGRAAEIYGAKSLLMLLALGTGLGSLLFPISATLSESIVFAYIVRVVIGLSQGGLFPAVYVLLCKWLPKKERSSWLAVPSAFGRFGTIAMNLIVPILYRKFGWEMVFYFSGFVTLFWGLVFLAIAADCPQTSRWISQKELMFIEARMEPQLESLTKQPVGLKTASGFTINEQGNEQIGGTSTNWLKMLTNKPLLVLALVMFTSEWCNVLLLVKLPGFLLSVPVFDMNLEEYGMWNSLLVGVYCIHYPLSGVIASKIERRGVQSLKVRKIFEAIAHALQAAGCIVIAFYEDKTVVLIALFVIMVGRSTVGGGQCLMPPELSREFPGSVMALANSIANTAGIIGPRVVSWLVVEPTEFKCWRSLWLLSAGIFVFGGSVFCLFAENRPQNYCKKPKSALGGALSQVQLCSLPSQVDEEIIKMDAFARVAAAPKQQSGNLNDVKKK